MGAFTVATRNLGHAERSQDRVEVIEHADGLVVALADGSGGMAGGAEAAELVVQAVRDAHARGVETADAAAWCGLLGDLDERIAVSPHGGETTAVLLGIDTNGIVGASVGDSEAWLVLDDGFEDLTAHQHAKARLGTGMAVPAPFSARPWAGTLLVASDGLTKFAAVEALLEAARLPDLEAAATRLVDLVRLRSGALQDDVSLVLIRRTT